jgi:CheY-like chemotaxis protein
VVEDSETQALALRGRLEAEGYVVDTVGSAEAALERLNGPLPDLVVADFHLPGMDGRELSRQLRLNRRTRTLPLLMLTSAREQDLERQGLCGQVGRRGRHAGPSPRPAAARQARGGGTVRGRRFPAGPDPGRP